jgi:CRP-like cAMP-binding protein
MPHAELIKVFRERPNLSFAVWRETLIDASIFREAITNNSSRTGACRIAHFFAEIYFRAGAVGLVEGTTCRLPLNQRELGELLGMSMVTVNRHIQSIRRSRAASFKSGRLIVTNWNKLATMGDFDAQYLHSKKRTP